MYQGSEEWITALRAALSDIPDQDLAAEWSAWDEFERIQRPVLTLLGAYNAGKTTLLIRFLLIEGRKVPEWLTVSARPQTFNVEQTDALGWSIRDTPGFSAGQPTHEARTEAALLRSDAFLIVLGPQLLTGEREAILRLLSGRQFSRAGAPLAPGVAQIVVNRMDEAMDPVDNEAGYEAMVARKRESLLDQLRCAGLQPGAIPLHFVIADYAGQFASAAPGELRAPDPAEQPWDGIPELAEALRRAASSAGPLRQAARIRFYLWVAQQTGDRVAGQLEMERKKLSQLRSSIKERTLAEQELRVLVDAARSELDGLIQTELLSLERGAYEERGLTERIVEKLGKELAQWTERYDLKLRRLTEQIGEGVGRAPDFDPNEWLRLAQVIDGKGGARSEGWAVWLRRIRERWTGWHQAMIKMNAVDWLISAGFGTDTERRRATRNLFGQSTFVQISPWLIELAGLLVDGAQERQAAHERAQRRSELRRQVEEAARRMASVYLEGDREAGIPGWLDGVSRLRERLEQSLADQANMERSLDGNVSRLESCQERLSALLGWPAAPQDGAKQETICAPIPIVSLHVPEDASYFVRLSKHLSSVEATEGPLYWKLDDIKAGMERSVEIDRRIDQARVILLGVSADALASETWRQAARRALGRHARKEAIIIPILMRPVPLGNDPLGLGALQFLPRNGQPLSQCSDLDAACSEIATEVMKAKDDALDFKR